MRVEAEAVERMEIGTKIVENETGSVKINTGPRIQGEKDGLEGLVTMEMSERSTRTMKASAGISKVWTRSL